MPGMEACISDADGHVQPQPFINSSSELPTCSHILSASHSIYKYRLSTFPNLGIQKHSFPLEADRSMAGNGQGKRAPKGHFVVYVGSEMKRFVMPTYVLNNPVFQELLDRAADEYGLHGRDKIVLPCDELTFLQLTALFFS